MRNKTGPEITYSENERYAVRVLGKFHRNSGNRLKRFKVAANRQFLEFSVFDDFYVEYF